MSTENRKEIFLNQLFEGSVKKTYKKLVEKNPEEPFHAAQV